MIQNHLLQIVSYLAMEAPSSTYAEAIRDEQAKVLRTVRPLSGDNMVRGQFRGYRDEPGVAKDSYMATYAALRLYVDSWRWEGVPFYVRAGKCLKMTATEVFVEFRNPPQVVFTEPTPPHRQLRALPPEPPGGHRHRGAGQAPGEGMAGRPVELSVADQAEQGDGGPHGRLRAAARRRDGGRRHALRAPGRGGGGLGDRGPGDPRPEPDVRVRAGDLGPAARPTGWSAEVGGWNTPQ